METIQREHDKPRGSKPLIRETLWIINKYEQKTIRTSDIYKLWEYT